MSRQAQLTSFFPRKAVVQHFKCETVNGDACVKDEPVDISPSPSDPSDASDAVVQGPFLCEACESSRDGGASSIFKTREHLLAHTVKRHPTTCLCCFETFDNSSDLSEHVEVNGHRMSVCDGCKSVFPDEAAMQGHNCEASKETPSEAVRSCMLTAIKDEEMSTGGESDLSSDDDDDDDYNSGECEDIQDSKKTSNGDRPRRFRRNIKKEEVSSDAESDSESSTNGWKGNVCDVKLECLHCSADGFKERAGLIHHTGLSHPNVCCICFEGFDDEESLNCHQKSLRHYWWKCTTCRLVFIRKLAFYRHMRFNHPQQCPFRCTKCDNYGTCSKATLIHHLRKHHGEDEGCNLNELNNENEKTKSERPMKDVVKDELIGVPWNILPNACTICKLNLDSSYSLVLHMFRNHNEPGQTHVFKCELCNLGFRRGRAFEHHLKEFHSENEDYLRETRLSVESIFKHLRVCKLCPNLKTCYRGYSGLRRHERTWHPSLRPEKCRICSEIFLEKSDLALHLYNDHDGPLPFACPVCGQTRPSMSTLDMHLERAHDYKMIPLYYCFTHEKSFLEHCHLRGHLKRKHKKYACYPELPPRLHYCEICKKNVKNKSQHMQNHEKAEPVKCNICGAMMQRKSYLQIHMKKHTDQFQCKVCGKSFELKSFLERHAVVHSGEKPFQCELCGLRVSQKSSLQRHVKVVHKGGTVVETGRPPSARRTRGPAGSKGKGNVGEVENGRESVPVAEAADGPRKESSQSACAPRQRGRSRKKKAATSSEEESSVTEEEDMDLSSEEEQQHVKRRRVSARGGRRKKR